jgi:Gluconate 2-dehydrogenase subunit 3
METAMPHEPPILLTLFSERQAATLRALVDRLIPPDDFPGGWEAGAGDYLALQLVGDLGPLLDQYRVGLDALDAEAQATNSAHFAALDAEAQDALLGQVEAAAVVTPWPVDPVVFFRQAVEHTAEAYYGDPGNGGNHDAAAWRMVGFEVRG